MTLRMASGAETTVDLGQSDAEVIAGSGGSTDNAIGPSASIVAVPLNGQGAQSYLLDASVSGGNASVQCQAIVANGAGATTDRLVFWTQLNGVTTPAFDVPVVRADASGVVAGSYEIRWERLTDGKVHLFVQGVEIDAANAFTPLSGAGAFGATFGLRLEIGLASPWPIRLYESTDNAVTWTLRQSGTGSSGQKIGGVYFCEALGKGVNHNWQMRLDNISVQDDGGGDTTYSDTSLIDAVYEGAPDGDTGTFNAWTNHLGAACSLGTSGCFAEVDEGVPPVTTDYVQWSGATTPEQAQSFPTTSRVLKSTDTVLAVRPAAYLNRAGANAVYPILVSAAVEAIPSSQGQPAAGATRWQHTGSQGYAATDPQTSAAWTVGGAKACEVGYAVFGADAATVVKCMTLMKIVYYKIGAAVLPPRGATSRPAVTVRVPPPQRPALLLFLPAGAPVTPQRRRWVQVS